ncbi:MAG: hypothetical protein WA854_13880 [Candidatus Binataceae bacterium]
MSNRMRAYIIASIVAFAAAAGWVGCGVKSPPIPRQLARPQRILDLRADSEKGAIKLSWGRPDTYASGAAMHNLESFLVMRTQGQGSYREIGRVEVTDNGRFQKQETFTYRDSDTVVGQSYSYEIVSITSNGFKSEPSNEVALVRSVPPPPPNPENFVVPTPAPLP